MTTPKRTNHASFSACAGGACHVSRRNLVKGATALAGGAMIAGIPTSTLLAQDADETAMIPRLNGGSMGGGTNPQANFNPFSPNRISGTQDLIFERLYFVNGYSCEEIPWLAESYTWSSDSKTLTFTIRDGVTWNDGSAFTADDVAFTFTMVMKTPALDLNGATKGLDTVEARDNTVVFTFASASAPSFYPIAETRIVPKAVWEKQKDPVTFVNADAPVGTGPYTLKNFNSEEVVYGLRQDYWQVEDFRLQEVGFSKAAEGQANMLRLANGEYDWDAQYIPNVEKVYVARDPDHNKYWFDQGACISLYMNLTKKPFDDVAFRKAVAYAVNRDEIAKKAELGYVTTASQTGLKLPAQEAWLNPDIKDQGNIPYDKDQAKSILTDAGYTYDGDTLKSPDGKNVEFTFKVQAGWSDWVQAANIIKGNLEDVGMKVNIESPDPAIINDKDRPTGNYDVVFGVHGGNCSMYRNYFDHLSSTMSAPIGKAATSNFERWEDKKTDDLLGKFLAAGSEDEQKEIAYQLQTIMVEQFPTIPLWYGAVWFEYRTEHAVGWPNADDPYCASGDLPLIFMKLRAPA